MHLLREGCCPSEGEKVRAIISMPIQDQEALSLAELAASAPPLS